MLNLTINAIFTEKMTVTEKKIANVCQHKNMCITILNMHTKRIRHAQIVEPFSLVL